MGTATLLIIAGSDSGGGAGIQADIKTASARGVYATTAITAITAQNTRGVQEVEVLPPDLVATQIRSVLEDIGADAIKIGMLGSAGIAAAVAGALDGYNGRVVLDPVMVAKSGDQLLPDDAVTALRDRLLPRASLLTPNLPEAARLLGCDIARDQDEVARQGAALRDLGPRAVLVKGGHGPGPVCRDLLVHEGAPLPLEAPRRDTANTHGTGCSLAAALAAELAKGAGLPAAAATAHAWLQGALAEADTLRIGHGHGPVHHFHGIWA